MAQNSPDEITPMQQSTCTCVSPWYHDYFRCQGWLVPRYHISRIGDWNIHGRAQQFGYVMGGHHEIYGALREGSYPGLWQAAIQHDAQTFIRFLTLEPTRIEQQWANRTDDTAHLRQKFLRYCNMAFVVLGTLLQPGTYEYVFREPLHQGEGDIMVQAKNKYCELYWAMQTRHFNPHWHHGGWNHGTVSAQDSESGSGSGSNTIVGDGDSENAPAQEGQLKKDSGVGLDEKGQEEIATARDNVESTENHDPAPVKQSNLESRDRDNASIYTAEGVLTEEVQSAAEFIESSLESAVNHPAMIGALFIAPMQANEQRRQGQSGEGNS
ncbi:hypothetical protein BDZ45DRAFT_734447 [Acephala macrosclerotiorum]|nr:hypothetical protein BDZ45DRAFT_734447 [Acephala macrosclerotiorum]